MGAYPKIKKLQIGDSIMINTNLGEEKYSDKDIRQIIVRKKKHIYHHKLVYLTIILFFLLTSILVENSLILGGILIAILLFWMLPKYEYSLKINFAISSKKYQITQQQYQAFKPLAYQYNQAHKSTNA
jgi:pheromone shutdown protein TraB